MKPLIKILIISTAVVTPLLLRDLRAQNATSASTKLASWPHTASRAWHHRFADKTSWPYLKTPPNLFNAVTGNGLSSFRYKETALLKTTSTQKKLIADHALSGDVQVAWAQQYGSQFLPSADAASDIAVDHHGNVYVTGYLTNQPFGQDYFTTKYDATGRKLWEARYNGDANGDDFATAIAVDAAGNVYVTGSSMTVAHASDYVTIKYNTNGAMLWLARYDFQNAANRSYDAAQALAIDDSGNAHVSGWSENDFATVKYNAAGVEQWQARYPGSGSTEVSAMQVDRSGNVYLAGQNNEAFIIVKYNFAGQKEWSAGYSEFTNSRGLATALAIDQRGDVYATGMHEGLGPPQYLTIKFNQDGMREWVARYRGTESCNWNIATALTLDDSGAVYVTGESGWFQEICDSGGCTTREDIDYATIKYNRAGVMQWSARYGPAESCNHAAAISLDRTGNVVVTGNDQRDFVAVKYDREGTPQWLNVFNDGDETEDAAITSTIDGRGNVYVTGWSMRNQDSDWATMKFNGAGVTQWVARENSPGNSFDIAKALALDPNGNVVVAGASQNTADAATMWTVINYHSKGVINWQRHGRREQNFRNTAEKIVVDAEGNSYILVAAFDVSRLFHGYGALVKNNRDGRELLRAAFDSTAAEGYSRPTALAIDRLGNIYVTGASRNADFATIKYDAKGNVLWHAHENSGALALNGAAAMAIDDTGNVYVTGLADGKIVTIKYNPSGIKQWLARYHAAEAVNRVAAIAIEPSPAGGNIVVLAGIGYDSDDLTIKYHRDGGQLWEARYSRPENSFEPQAALAIDHWGNVYVAGDAATIKYNRDGATMWTVAGAVALAVDESGNLYTTGAPSDATGSHDAADFFTTKYNTLGIREWSARYDGPGNSLDYPVALALDQSHNVYVTGHSRSNESQHWSYCTTIKYTQNAVAVHDKKPNTVKQFYLAQNFPNPFNPSTRIRYSLAQSGPMTLKIFDVLGREIATLVNAIKPAGEYDVQWAPENLPAGVYIYRLQAGDPSASSGQSFVESKKLLYLP